MSDIARLEARIAELEGHRTQWRRKAQDLETAFRAYLHETENCVAVSGFFDDEIEAAKVAAKAALVAATPDEPDT